MKSHMLPAAGVVLLLVALSLTGCAMGEGMIDPPQLQLVGVPELVAPRITDITVKNGAGEVLLDGKPDGKGLASSNPDRSKLDGTLVVTSRWSDGYSDTQTIKHEPGKPVKISRDGPRWRAEVQETPKVQEEKPGILESLMPSFGFGFGFGGERDRGRGRETEVKHPR